MIAYIARGQWKGILDPDERGDEKEVFLAYNDEHAREKAREIANRKRFELRQILRVTKKGNVDISLSD